MCVGCGGGREPGAGDATGEPRADGPGNTEDCWIAKKVAKKRANCFRSVRNAEIEENNGNAWHGHGKGTSGTAHSADKFGNVLGRCFRANAMPEIEDMGEIGRASC